MTAPTLGRSDAATSVVDVSVVLPCLNEEHSVGDCVREALAAGAAEGLRVEVIVVDNGSADASALVARTAGARVVAEATAGYGAALSAGIRCAKAPVVVMADADSTYALDRLGDLVRPVRSGSADLVLGSRLAQATNLTMPLLHRLVGTPTLTFLVREGTGVAGLSDSQSGFRAFRRDTMLGLGLSSTGMEYASEMLIRASQASLRVAEVPLGYRPRVGDSKLNTWRDGWRHLRLIARMSPHVLLWYPGWALTVAAFLGFGVSFTAGTRTTVGSTTWQPIFFSPTMLVIGLCAILTAAVVGHHLPSSPPQVKAHFAWVSRPTFHGLARAAGVAMGLAGMGLDLALFVAEQHHADIPLYQRITWAGTAQSLILSAILLLAFSLLYRLLARSGRATAPQPDEDTPWYGS